jgi:hypothetical protein
MANNITSTILFDNVVFCFEPVENANLYRIVVNSPTATILDVAKTDLKPDTDNLLKFPYPKNSSPISPLLPHLIRVATVNSKGIFSARAEFTLLDGGLPEQFKKLREEIGSGNQAGLDAFLNATLKSPQIFGSKEKTFDPGCLRLELSSENNLDSLDFVSELNFDSPNPIAFARASGGWPGWPR